MSIIPDLMEGTNCRTPLHVGVKPIMISCRCSNPMRFLRGLPSFPTQKLAFTMGLSMFSPDFSFISSGRGPAAVVAAAPASGNATSHVQADRQNRGSRGSTCSGDLWEFRCPPKLGLTSGKLTVCELENHHFL